MKVFLNVCITDNWTSPPPLYTSRTLQIHTRTLLEHLYDVYNAETSPSKSTMVEKPLTTKSVFLDAILNMLPSQQRSAISELKSFFNNTYPCFNGNAPAWWKVCNSIVLSLIYLKQESRTTLLISWCLLIARNILFLSSASSLAANTPCLTLSHHSWLSLH